MLGNNNFLLMAKKKKKELRCGFMIGKVKFLVVFFGFWSDRALF